MKYEVIGLKIGVWANYMVIHHVLSRKVQLKVFGVYEHPTGQLERGSNSVVEALFSCCKAVLKQETLKSNIRCHLDMRFYLFWGHLLLLLLWPITAYQPGWSRPLLGGFPGLTKYQDFR